MCLGRKLKPCIIFKGVKNPQNGGISTVKGGIRVGVDNDSKERYPGRSQIIIDCNPKAYVYGDEMSSWMSLCWPSRLNPMDSVGTPPPCVLQLDDYKWHGWTKNTKYLHDQLEQKHNTFASHIEGTIIPVGQMLDLAPNRLYKDGMKCRTFTYLINCDRDAKGSPIHPGRPTICKWVIESWAAVPTDVFIRSAVACGAALPEDYPEDTRKRLKVMAGLQCSDPCGVLT